MKTAVVLGAGGFIGHHMARRLRAEGYWVRGVDRRLPEFSPHECDEFLLVDLARTRDLREVLTCRGDAPTEIYQFAANMGGAGFIFTGDNDADIMRESVMINNNVLESLLALGMRGQKLLYASSACIYPHRNQVRPEAIDTSEDSAYPADPDSEYGWEKLFSERLYQAHARNHGLDLRIARYHNVYGPESAWQGGREKAPTALCRKVAQAADSINIWGDGTQIRSFLYIDDAVEGTFRLMQSDVTVPVNIGSDHALTINQLVSIIARVAGRDVSRRYLPGPTGVPARTSDNRRCRELLGWEPKHDLESGISITYQWIQQQLEEPADSNVEAPVETKLVPCGCGRSATGFCTGLHRLTDEEWDRKLMEDMGLEYQPNKEDVQ